MFKLLTILLYSITIFYNFSMANSTVGLGFWASRPAGNISRIEYARKLVW